MRSHGLDHISRTNECEATAEAQRRKQRGEHGGDEPAINPQKEQQGMLGWIHDEWSAAVSGEG